MIVTFLWALLAICGLNCRNGCCNDVALHLHGRLLLLLLQPLQVTEHLVSMCDEIVVLFASDVLALVVVVVVALIFVKFNELLIGLVNLLSCGPYLVQGFVDCAAWTLGWSVIVQGQCLHKHVSDKDKRAVISLGRGVEVCQLLCCCFFSRHG
jgi:hypothetical protein